METRERILATGRALLAEEGLRAVTTQAIAQRARISKKTLYQQFPSKEALLEAILISFMEENLGHWDRILERDESAMDRIVASLRFVSEFLPHIQTRLINQVESLAPQLWEKMDAIRTKRLSRLKSLMEEAQQERFLRADVNPDHWILLLVGAIRAVVTPQVLLRTGISLGELISSIQTIYYDGLLTEKGKRHIEGKETS